MRLDEPKRRKAYVSPTNWSIKMPYAIVKFRSDSHPSRRVKTVATLEDAQRICQDPSTSSIRGTGRPIYTRDEKGNKKRVDWFYGYTQVNR